MKTSTLIQLIAKNCQWRKTVNEAYSGQCESRLDKLEAELPRGSGIDCGCKIDRENSGDKKVIITFDYHFMDDNGYYDGWGSFKLIVTPNLSSYPDMRITGRDRRQIKDYFYDLFSYELFETLIDESVFYE